MLKNIAIALVVFGVTASVQAALTVSYFYSFVPVGYGEVENPHVKGQAIVVYSPDVDGGTTYAQLSMRHLEPNTQYGVLIEGDQSGESNPVAFWTDSAGRGTYTTNFLQDGATGAHITIYIWDGNVETIDVVTADEARAEGVLFDTLQY